MNTQRTNRIGKQNRVVLALTFIVMSVLQNGCGIMAGGLGGSSGGLADDAAQTASAQGPVDSPLAGDVSTDLTQSVTTARKSGGISGNTTRAEVGNPQGGGDKKGGDGDKIGTPSTKHPAGNGSRPKGKTPTAQA